MAGLIGLAGLFVNGIFYKDNGYACLFVFNVLFMWNELLLLLMLIVLTLFELLIFLNIWLFLNVLIPLILLLLHIVFLLLLILQLLLLLLLFCNFYIISLSIIYFILCADILSCVWIHNTWLRISYTIVD